VLGLLDLLVGEDGGPARGLRHSLGGEPVSTGRNPDQPDIAHVLLEDLAACVRLLLVYAELPNHGVGEELSLGELLALVVVVDRAKNLGRKRGLH
jgi:hypothetical protein